MTCVNCHTPNDPTSRFCTSCGAGIPLPAPTAAFADVADSNGPASPAWGKFDQAYRSASTQVDEEVTHFASASSRERTNTVHSSDQNEGATVRIGRIIDDKYRIDATIGFGGMGSVYRAARLLIGDEVAIKILHPKHVSEPGASERFKREAQAAARIKHPNAVFIIDFGITSDGLVYLVMELLHGETLRAIIKQEGPIRASSAVEILNQICGALEEAHRHQVVHRDLKPENILVQTTISGLRVTVLDFGIAKLHDLSASALTQVGGVLGTPHYMSPEQCLGEEIDFRSDIYSLGIVLYEMLAGVVPFRKATSNAVVVQQVNQAPPPLREVNAAISPAVEAVVMQALAKRREDRPQSARALAAAFSAAVNAPWPGPTQYASPGAGQYGGGAAGLDPTMFVTPPTRLSIDLPPSTPLGSPSGTGGPAGQNTISIGLIVVGALGLLAIGALGAVLLVGAGGRSTVNNNNNATPSPRSSVDTPTPLESTPESTTTTPPVKPPMGTDSTKVPPTPPPIGPPTQVTISRDFSREYYGTMGGKDLHMSLQKSGSSLSGSATTSRTDVLSGTVNSDGSFTLNGFENGSELTGRYTGRLNNDGSISGGRWTSTRGRGSASFSVR